MSGPTITDWSQPQPVSDLDMAFGVEAMKLMPSRAECDAALQVMNDRGRAWREFQARWFFEGLPAGTKFSPKPGVDGRAALRHLRVIQGSFEPQHEHKEAAVAYLASLWFNEIPGGAS